MSICEEPSSRCWLPSPYGRSLPQPERSAEVLQTEPFHRYVEAVNRDDPEGRTDLVTNAEAWKWMKENIPFFESSDKSIEEMYYFRWWMFRKHIRQTPEGCRDYGVPAGRAVDEGA